MNAFLQLNTIFISMVMEAIPFVLVGVLVSGLIQMFLTEQWIARVMPKNRLLSTVLGCGVGVLFPACECGIVPITRRLLRKGVPLHAGIAFMLTGPIINPIVLFATYIAFGNDWRMVGIRSGLAIAVAFCVALILSFAFPKLPMREYEAPVAAALEPGLEMPSAAPARPLSAKLGEVVSHAIEEFFSVGKYLVIGAFLAASMQTFVPTATLLHLGSDPLRSSLVMIALAFVMSLCSEADAFIASSFRSSFTIGSLSAFLVFGPMIDIKNTLMLLATFRAKFVATLIGLVVVFTLLGSLLVGRLFG
ncbi:permease [Cohnella nanjingensis]|uniref:Permease n=1 Tax=Cohnella nanjingensis TaxID=1387779 RepID=A0A7X0VG43_9BACL|nr:permease [Cohnella nanjingensis]MBB6672712.1 permease [Cohnella nanjingensis]